MQKRELIKVYLMYHSVQVQLVFIMILAKAKNKLYKLTKDRKKYFLEVKRYLHIWEVIINLEAENLLLENLLMIFYHSLIRLIINQIDQNLIDQFQGVHLKCHLNSQIKIFLVKEVPNLTY